MPADRPTAWLAAGVRHELLMRVLPGLRHDLLGLVSVVRMSAAILARQLGRVEVDTAACQGRATGIDTHLAALIQAIRGLQHWDPSANASEAPPADPSGLLVTCTDLLRPPLALRQILLVVEPAPASPATVAQPAFLYAALALLAYWQDRLDAPAEIVLRLDDGNRLSATVRQRPAIARDALPSLQAAEQPRPRIDAESVAWLLADQGWTLELQDDCIATRWPLSRS